MRSGQTRQTLGAARTRQQAEPDEGVAESVAAWSLGVHEPLFHVLQAAVLVVAGLSLAWLPVRWTGAVPLIGAGILHLVTVTLGAASTVGVVALGRRPVSTTSSQCSVPK